MSKIRFTGDWAGTKNWFNEFPAGAPRRTVRVMDRFARKVARDVRTHIINQDLDWTELAASTVSRKGHPFIYIDSGKYANSITLNRKKEGDKFHIILAPRRGMASGGLTFQELGLYMEYGTTTMPARPLWRPTYDKVLKEAPFTEILEAATKGF
jgi:hypothetical protein